MRASLSSSRPVFLSTRFPLALLALLALASLASPLQMAATPPRYDYVVIVVEENRTVGQNIGDLVNAPYLNSLASGGVRMGAMFAIEHPSQPNYLQLFSGSNQGVTDDNLPSNFSITPASTNGLPAARYLANVSNGLLEVEFPRRKGTTAAGLSYAVQFSSDLATWSAGQAPVVTSISAGWDRVTVRDAPAGPNSSRFARIVLTLQP